MTGPAGWHTDPTDPRVQRYWNGIGWTAQRVWTGAQWVEAPVAAPAGAPRPAGRSARRRQLPLWIAGAAALAVIVLVTVIATTGGGSGKASAGPAAGAVSPAAAGLSSGFCATVFRAVDRLSTLNTKAIMQDPAPTAAQWRQAEPAVRALGPAAPASLYERDRFQQDVATLVSDLDDIVANGFADSNGGAQLDLDGGAVETDAERAGCRPS